ncbi:MAG: MBL fold metallo-hydrolase [Acidobacteriota bacterium]
MNDPVGNLRIHFYGVQGSGSVFPDRRERLIFQEHLEFELLENVFRDLQQRADKETGKFNCRVEDILGGPINRENLEAYRKRFPVKEFRSYGGWTTCFWFETADDYDIIFDCGSGFRNCAKDLQAKWGERPRRDLYIFGSHSHFDHTEGFDQAAVCFDPRNTLHIYGNRQFLRSLDSNLGIFSHFVDEGVRGVQTPIFYDLMPTEFLAYEIRDLELYPEPDDDPLAHRYQHLHEPVRLGETRITAFEVCHPAPCFGYRVDRGGKSFVFCTDHELRHGSDPADPRQKASLEAEARVRRNTQGADVLYRDGQFLRLEYDGVKGIGNSAAVSRIDWGHSCIEDVQEMARQCGVKRTFVGHHDPNRDWAERNEIDESLRRLCGGDFEIELACAETVIDL